MKKRLMSLLLASSMSTASLAQQPRLFDDMLTQQMHQQLTAELTVRQDPEIVRAQAKAMRALYDALIKEGFSKEEALTLVAASIERNQ